MARGKASTDPTTLQMALVGYQIEKQKIEDRIREIQAQLRGNRIAQPSAAGEKEPARPRRVLSSAARKRIAAAQRKRWAEHRKKLAQSKHKSTQKTAT
jgi:hypothetical protein